MKNLNYSRKIDTLGRVVIPSKLRDIFGIQPGDEIEFFSIEVDGLRYLCIPCPHAAPSRDLEENSK